MTIKTTLLTTAAAITVALLAQPAAAFTAVDGAEPVSAPDSRISTIWTPMTAARGDTIWSACEPFGSSWETCMREFVVNANRERFPERLDSSDDFFLTEGVVYLVPSVDGAIASAPAAEAAAAPAGPTGFTPAEWQTFLTEVEEERARMASLREEVDSFAADLARLDIGALGDDFVGIAALVTRLSELEASIPDVSSLESGLSEAAAFIALLQNGNLEEATALQTAIDGRIAAAVDGRFQALDVRIDGIVNEGGIIDQRVDAAVTELTAAGGAIETAVNEATSGFDGRLTAVEDNLGPLGSLPWFITLPMLLGLLGLMAGGIAWAMGRDVRRKVNDEETGLAATHQMASDHRSVIEAQVYWDDENTGLETLPKLSGGETNAVVWLCRTGGETYEVKIWREDDTPPGQVKTNIVRNVQSGQLSDPMSVKRLKTKIVAAIADGRIEPLKQKAVA